MKKHLPKLIFVAVVLAVIFGGKAFIDYKTIDYKSIVNNGISNFFISGNTSELEPVIELLDKYANDEEIRNYTNELLGISTQRNEEVTVSEETLNIIKAGMRLVTSSGGTAYSIFRDFEYSVAGKTGSAQAKTKEKGEKKWKFLDTYCRNLTKQKKKVR